MSLGKRILFYAFLFGASFVLLNSVVFLIHSVYRPPSVQLVCGGDSGIDCARTETTLMTDVNTIYRLNVQGSFYLIAMLTIMLAPFMGRKDLFPALLYSFGMFAAVFAFLATRKRWFFELGSESPESLVSMLLFMICLGVSYLLYKRAEFVLDAANLKLTNIGRPPLVKNTTRIK